MVLTCCLLDGYCNNLDWGVPIEYYTFAVGVTIKCYFCIPNNIIVNMYTREISAKNSF